MSDISQKAMLNLGCGTLILPCPRPIDRTFPGDEVWQYPKWHNVDKIANKGVDEIVDLFAYPWSWADNSFSGAAATHLVEHIPHYIKIRGDDTEYDENDLQVFRPALSVRERKLCGGLRQLQNGFFAFFAELWRVLEPGAIAHIVVPLAYSWEAVVDPDHRRYFVPATFSYLCEQPENAPYRYNVGSKWTFAQEVVFSHTLGDNLMFNPEWATHHLVNSANYFYVQLATVK